MKVRLITTFILMPLIVAILFWFTLFNFVITVIIISMIAAWEWGKLAKITGNHQIIWLFCFFCLLLLTIFHVLNFYHFNLYYSQMKFFIWLSINWWITAFILLLYYPLSAVLWRESRILVLIFGIFTLIPFCWSLITLRQYHYDINHFSGSWWLLYIFCLVWSLDSGAYIFGKYLGKHYMAPKVSPNKTWEGIFGGFLFIVIISYLFEILKIIPIKTSILIILTIALTAIIGDLTESMFKREIGIKDSSNLIPGHGGILDRIDSLTAVVPIFICLLMVVLHIF